MQYKSFAIPVLGSGNAVMEEELNSFLRGHRVLAVRRELFSMEAQAYWCYSVEYLEGKGLQERESFDRSNRPDYREILPPEEFERFRVLRDVRKKLAEEESVPPYAIFLDTNLAELSKLREVDETSLRKVKGFGEKKYVRFGVRFLELLRLSTQKENRDGADAVEESEEK